TIGGDLTIKVENNTEVGLGIYREEVMDKTQSLDDAQVEFARLGSLLLLKVLPYREEQWRYLVFNSLTGKVERIDAIGLACIQLPEDHG
ncbi:DNA repair ATPase, partial [Escherichia coli]|nr:DNA repair ATPase [Escherichia coli]